MDSRSAAHVLSQIGALLQVKGEQRFKARAYAGAARALIALDTDDLGPLPPPWYVGGSPRLRTGTLTGAPGFGLNRRAQVLEAAQRGIAGGLAESTGGSR